MIADRSSSGGGGGDAVSDAAQRRPSASATDPIAIHAARRDNRGSGSGAFGESPDCGSAGGVTSSTSLVRDGTLSLPTVHLFQLLPLIPLSHFLSRFDHDVTHRRGDITGAVGPHQHVCPASRRPDVRPVTERHQFRGAPGDAVEYIE